MPKNKSKNTSIYSYLRTLPVLAIVASVLVGGSLVRLVHADQFDAQIAALQGQNSQAKATITGLQAQAATYQGAIDQLQAQINAIQSQIAVNENQQTQLQAQIVTDQAEIDHDKQVLSDIIKSMYVDGQLTTIEELATSKNLSDYVDKQEYRTAVQNKMNTTIKQIAELQAQLQKQKAEIDLLLSSEKSQNDQLSSARSQQSQLLSYNQSQQDTYNQKIASNTSQIAEQRRLQAIENAKYNIGNFRGDPGNGGYPNVWAYAPQDSMIDSWGMYNRECVSYTAYRVHQDYLLGKDTHDMPWWGGSGNANQWDDNARAAGIPVDSDPTPGSIAVSNAGYYGHVMYVESVSPDKSQIYVQQYNQQLTGQYSEGWRYTTGLVFIHF